MTRRSAFGQRRLDLGDVIRRRAAASTDQANAPLGETPRVRRHVFGRRQVDRAPFDIARPSGVGLRGQPNRRRRGHALERLEHVRGTDAAIDADEIGPCRLQRRRELLRRRAVERVAIVLDRHLRHDRQRADAAHGGNRRADLVQVAKRFEDEEVDAAVDERLCLFAKYASASSRPIRPHGSMRKTKRTDRAGDVGRPARAFARQASAGVIDLAEAIGQTERAQLDAIRAERVGLDDVSARLRVGLVHRDHARRIAQVQGIEGAIDEDALRVEHRAHPTIADEDALVERFEKGREFAERACCVAGGATSRSALSQMKSSLL